MGYLSNWPDYQVVAESPAGRIMAYMIGKAEGKGKNWHGHVSAVTVAPEYRRLGLARALMKGLEEASEKVYVSVIFLDLCWVMWVSASMQMLQLVIVSWPDLAAGIVPLFSRRGPCWTASALMFCYFNDVCVFIACCASVLRGKA